MPLAIFDLDNTLIDRARAVRRWARRWVDRYSLDPAEATWLIAADGDGYVNRRTFLSAVRERYDLRESVDTMLVSYRAQIVELTEPDAAVPAALTTLREDGWTIAIATNGTTDQQWAKIRRTGLDRHVDAVAVSEEVGVPKPDQLMFVTAAERCGVNLADGGWMVGDNADRDIAGAQAVGLHTIWIHRGRTWTDGPAPDAIVGDAVEAVTTMLVRARRQSTRTLGA